MRSGITKIMGGARYAEYLSHESADGALRGMGALEAYYGRGAVLCAVDAGHGVASRGTLDEGGVTSWLDWADPVTGARRGVRRDGQVAGYEVVLNDPRDFDLAALVPGAEDIARARVAAQERAGRALLEWMSRHLWTRRGHGGAEHVRVTGIEAVMATHATTREGDPMWHTHVTVLNRVQCGDGVWRTIDSRQMFSMIGLMHSVYDRAFASDPELRAALAAHGLDVVVDDAGIARIPQLRDAAAAMSKRGRQIDAEAERRLDAWRDAHPGVEPTPGVLRQLRQEAWRVTRAAKTELTAVPDPARWRAELAGLGMDLSAWSARTDAKAPARDLMADPLDAAERAALAGRVVARLEDSRSAWSRQDVERAALDELGRTLPVCDPATLYRQAAAVARDAMGRMVPLSDDPRAVQPWVRSLTTGRVIDVEERLTGRLAARGIDGGEPAPVAGTAREEGLDEGQENAMAQVCGTAALTVVEGAAGTGKTLMLRAADKWLAARGRRLVVVTPTLRAAREAGRTAASADTVMRLLEAYGWRNDEMGRGWYRVAPGRRDHRGNVYRGVPDGRGLNPGDVLVVDEAGMLCQDQALRLLELADEAGAKVALMGDSRQLSAVGRGGTLDIARRQTASLAEMLTVHRFSDPEWAGLSLAIRERRDPAGTARAIAGHMEWRADDDAVVTAIADAWMKDPGLCVSCGTNGQAALVNAEIQARRREAGQLGDASMACRDGMRVHAGDRIQTRRNDRALGVANRDTWTVTAIGHGELAARGEDGHTVRLSAGYVLDGVQLAYASTVYGVQGATADNALHWADEDTTDAAALYVGMTRGRDGNRVILAARDREGAIGKVTRILGADHADRGVADARRKAAAQISHDALPPEAKDAAYYRDGYEPGPDAPDGSRPDTAGHGPCLAWWDLVWSHADETAITGYVGPDALLSLARRAAETAGPMPDESASDDDWRAWDGRAAAAMAAALAQPGGDPDGRIRGAIADDIGNGAIWLPGRRHDDEEPEAQPDAQDALDPMADGLWNGPAMQPGYGIGI